MRCIWHLRAPLPAPAATSRFAVQASAATLARGQRTAEVDALQTAIQRDPGRDAALYRAGAAAVDDSSTLTAANGNSTAVALGINGGWEP